MDNPSSFPLDAAGVRVPHCSLRVTPPPPMRLGGWMDGDDMLFEVAVLEARHTYRHTALRLHAGWVFELVWG